MDAAAAAPRAPDGAAGGGEDPLPAVSVRGLVLRYDSPSGESFEARLDTLDLAPGQRAALAGPSTLEGVSRARVVAAIGLEARRLAGLAALLRGGPAVFGAEHRVQRGTGIRAGQAQDTDGAGLSGRGDGGDGVGHRRELLAGCFSQYTTGGGKKKYPPADRGI